MVSGGCNIYSWAQLTPILAFIERGQDDNAWTTKDIKYLHNLTRTLNTAVTTARAFRNDPEIAAQMSSYILNVEPIVKGLENKKKDVTINMKGKSKYPIILYNQHINNESKNRTSQTYSGKFPGTVQN